MVLDKFVENLNSIYESINVTKEQETEGKLPFLDIQIIRHADGSLGKSVYRRVIHMDIYVNSHHHPAQKRGVMESIKGCRQRSLGRRAYKTYSGRVVIPSLTLTGHSHFLIVKIERHGVKKMRRQFVGWQLFPFTKRSLPDWQGF